MSLFEQVVMVLENDGEFYKDYTHSMQDTFAKRRNCIRDHINRTPSNAWPSAVRYLGTADREMLRRYFDWHWGLDSPTGSNDVAHAESSPYFPLEDLQEFPPFTPGSKKAAARSVEEQTIAVVAECRKVAEDIHRWTDEQISQLAARSAQPLEFNMLKITTQTLLNGADIAKMTDEQLFDAIAQAETELKKLDEIQTKPKKLVAKMEELKAGITALVAHMDASKT